MSISASSSRHQSPRLTPNLLYRGTFSAASTPPDSPQTSPERALAPSGSIPMPHFDRLPPPAMNAHGTTPAPCDDHTHMDSQIADLALDDEDDERLHRHGSGSRHSPTDTDNSRPVSPALPPNMITTTLLHPSLPMATLPSAASSPGPIANHGSPSPTLSSAHSTGSHSLSPFSFFSNISNDHHSYPTSHGSSKTLRIELTQPDVILRTGQTTVMEGTLFVNANKNIKVKTLLLEFSGRSSVTWVDDNAYSPATRHTTAPHIEHSWAIIPHQHKQPATILPLGQHAYPFSLELPDTLPETLTTTHGKVAYRLTATLTKPGLAFHSSTVTIPVNVLRKHPPQPARAFHRGGRATSGADDKVQYKISVPQIRVPHSTKVPLQVSITTPNPRTSVSVLQVGLWERAVYRADGRRRVDMRLVKIQKSEGWPHEDRHGHPSSEAVTWNKVLLFDMPQMGSELNQCNPSADNGLMKVTHLLRFSILGIDGTKRFRSENEIDVKVLAFEDEYEVEDEDGDPANGGLPSYLGSFSTPRVSFDSERNMDAGDDDLLRAMVARIHLPTYEESEDDTNSRNTSRDVSRSVSRDVSRNVSRNVSRSGSPERSNSTGSNHAQSLFNHFNNHHHHHPHHHAHHHSLSHWPIPATSSPLAASPVSGPVITSPPVTSSIVIGDAANGAAFGTTVVPATPQTPVQLLSVPELVQPQPALLSSHIRTQSSLTTSCNRPMIDPPEKSDF